MKKKDGNLDNTDDSMMLEKNGYQIKLIEGGYDNIKITTSEDMEIMKYYLKNR